MGWAQAQGEAGRDLREPEQAVLGLNLRRVLRAERLLEGLNSASTLDGKARAAARQARLRDHQHQRVLAILAGSPCRFIPAGASCAGRSRAAKT